MDAHVSNEVTVLTASTVDGTTPEDATRGVSKGIPIASCVPLACQRLGFLGRGGEFDLQPG